MEQIDFLVDSTLGEIEVHLNRDGWASFGLQETDDPLLVEDMVRKATDVARCLTTVGLPAEEASELAAELWDELDEGEQLERARIPGTSSPDTTEG
ncbi:MAG TPA: hypothetical protein VNP73_08590 [Actinomycetota bacterium]|nr:hypothetical protein [Actinomycetota bacterium]